MAVTLLTVSVLKSGLSHFLPQIWDHYVPFFKRIAAIYIPVNSNAEVYSANNWPPSFCRLNVFAGQEFDLK